MSAAPPGLGLRIRAPSKNADADADAELDPLTNGLAPTEVLNEFGEGRNVYATEIYKIRNRESGALRGIRKVSRFDPSKPVLQAAQIEKAIYDTLKTVPDASRYILPYRQGKTNGQSAYINFNWKEGGDLIDYINAKLSSRTLAPAEAKQILFEIATKLKWLAKQGFIHRDIKFDNLYRAADGTILLFDFGFAMQIGAANENDMLIEMSNFIDKLVTPLAGLVFPIAGASVDLFRYGILSYAKSLVRSGLPVKDAIMVFYSTMIRMFRPSQEGGGKTRRRRHRNRKTRRRGQN